MNLSFKQTLDRIPDIGKYGLVLLTIVSISFLFPNNIRFKYEFERGQTWQYEDLYAPFDFPVKKSEEELRQEENLIEQNLSPFYYFDPEVVKRQKVGLEESFQAQLESFSDTEQFKDVHRNPKRYLQYGFAFLDRIYNRGVIQLAPAHQQAGKDLVIEVVRGNTKQKKTIQGLLDVEKAKDMIIDSLPYSKLYEAEFLLPILPSLIVPNIYFSDSLTKKFRDEQRLSVATFRGMVEKNELIVKQGGIITDEVHRKLVSFRDQYQENIQDTNSYLYIFLGYFLLTSLIIGVFIVYIQSYFKEIYQRFSRLIFILMWMVVYSYLVFVVESTGVISAYIIPFCIVPIVIKIFFTDRVAFFTHIVVIMIASFLSSLGYEFAILQILAGIVAIMSNPDARDWTKFFRSMVFIYLTYALAYLGLSLIQEGTLTSEGAYFYVWIFMNVFLTLLAYPLIPLLERLFGFTSSISLLELSDMNRPLLQELALQAPGTLQHSLQVANLSEAAANAIGADPLLVKVAALYHDIGKTLNPQFFIENQSGQNPHEHISHLESAQTIIEHVTEGEKLARKYRLPKILIDFIRTHHGTTRVEYFYRSYIKEHPERTDEEEKFRYPGPKPRTKEETILMLADSLEAASKSLKNPTGRDIDELVEKIIRGKIEHEQLNESEISFEELEKCRQVFRKRLRSINHVRVEYPEEQTNTNPSP